MAFKVKTDGSGYCVLHNFGWSFFGGVYGDSSKPLAALLETRDGVLYGTSYSGGQMDDPYWGGLGSVFKLNKDGSDYAIVHDFELTGGDGTNPRAGLTEGSDGVLYGTTARGGSGALGGADGLLSRRDSGRCALPD